MLHIIKFPKLSTQYTYIYIYIYIHMAIWEFSHWHLTENEPNCRFNESVEGLCLQINMRESIPPQSATLSTEVREPICFHELRLIFDNLIM